MKTRFAVSPTGFMHVGGVRTALFSWLAAKQVGGTFILRIEDTDKSREVEGAVEHIYESLKWLGLDWGEGPVVGGPNGPYIQSQRLERYKQVVEQMLADGTAYVDGSNPDDVATWRTAAQKDKRPFLFREFRDQALSPEAWDGSKPVRFKTPVERVNWHDVVRGDLTAGEEALDDFIIMKADGYPTYNFAHVVDDHEMGITHVIRGEEFIASNPKFIALHRALGYTLPTFITAPPILNANGGKKLSKRDGAKDVLQYRDEGYSVDGVLNFLATMGWNDGTEKEIFSKAELIESFSLDRIQKSGAKFDEERIDWINGHHIRNSSLDDLYAMIEPKFWPEAAQIADDEHKKEVLSLVQERLKFFAELDELTSFFFSEPSQNKELLLGKKLDQATAAAYLKAVITKLESNDFSEAAIEQDLRALVGELDTKVGLLFKLIRAGITGSLVAPGLFETMRVLGKETVLKRLQAAQAEVS